jgi:hypothetical protein
LDPKLIPFTVPLAAEVRLMRLLLLVPEDGVLAACSVIVNPLTVFPAPELLFLKVKFARLVLLAVKAESVTANMSPEVAVEVIDSVPVMDAIPEV